VRLARSTALALPSRAVRGALATVVHMVDARFIPAGGVPANKNGYIKSLKQLVHFYNTRDKYKHNVTSGHCPAGTTEKVDCWPMPEIPNNIDMTTGNLGLTDKEEDQIVAFLLTLTDGYTRPYPNRDTYTGTCVKGGSAKTQGNATLIPTPKLPACAAAICGVQPVPNPAIP